MWAVSDRSMVVVSPRHMAPWHGGFEQQMLSFWTVNLAVVLDAVCERDTVVFLWGESGHCTDSVCEDLEKIGKVYVLSILTVA